MQVGVGPAASVQVHDKRTRPVSARTADRSDHVQVVMIPQPRSPKVVKVRAAYQLDLITVNHFI